MPGMRQKARERTLGLVEDEHFFSTIFKSVSSCYCQERGEIVTPWENSPT